MGLQMVFVAQEVILGVHIPYLMSILEKFKNKRPMLISPILHLPFSPLSHKKRGGKNKQTKKPTTHTQLSHVFYTEKLKHLADRARQLMNSIKQDSF